MISKPYKIPPPVKHYNYPERDYVRRETLMGLRSLAKTLLGDGYQLNSTDMGKASTDMEEFWERLDSLEIVQEDPGLVIVLIIGAILSVLSVVFVAGYVYWLQNENKPTVRTLTFCEYIPNVAYIIVALIGIVWFNRSCIVLVNSYCDTTPTKANGLVRDLQQYFNHSSNEVIYIRKENMMVFKEKVKSIHEIYENKSRAKIQDILDNSIVIKGQELIDLGSQSFTDIELMDSIESVLNRPELIGFCRNHQKACEAINYQKVKTFIKTRSKTFNHFDTDLANSTLRTLVDNAERGKQMMVQFGNTELDELVEKVYGLIKGVLGNLPDELHHDFSIYQDLERELPREFKKFWSRHELIRWLFFLAFLMICVCLVMCLGVIIGIISIFAPRFRKVGLMFRHVSVSLTFALGFLFWMLCSIFFGLRFLMTYSVCSRCVGKTDVSPLAYPVLAKSAILKDFLVDDLRVMCQENTPIYLLKGMNDDLTKLDTNLTEYFDKIYMKHKVKEFNDARLIRNITHVDLDRLDNLAEFVDNTRHLGHDLETLMSDVRNDSLQGPLKEVLPEIKSYLSQMSKINMTQLTPRKGREVVAELSELNGSKSTFGDPFRTEVNIKLLQEVTDDFLKFVKKRLSKDVGACSPIKGIIDAIHLELCDNLLGGGSGVVIGLGTFTAFIFLSALSFLVKEVQPSRMSMKIERLIGTEIRKIYQSQRQEMTN